MLTVDCVDPDDATMRTSTSEMEGWLNSYSGRWNPRNAFTVGGTGAMGRLFIGNGRAVHPKEMAGMIAAAPSFSGKKRKLVQLGVSDSELGEASYAKQLGRLLGVKTSGCPAEAYFFSGGAMICGDKPVYPGAAERGIGRSGPAGFAMGGQLTMLFCPREGQSISPASILSASIAFGLYEDEIDTLLQRAESDGDAAFRLYQYYWIARRDPAQAMQWLTKAAALNHDVAQYNLAYEDFESGDPAKTGQAREMMGVLVAKGFAGPDLRTYYDG
ncbi:hypothetical protein [Sphingopyxis sp. R3-92]|uniref:hypothetical protein n=1 Tax=Sphingopyxis sp. R3-92 TaxID=3158553 RepID=UPI003EE7485F